MRAIILSPGSLTCGCALVAALVGTHGGKGEIFVLGDRRPDIDHEALMKQALEQMTLSVRYEKAEDYTFLEEPRTAYERRNRNRPWYDRFQKRQRRR